MKKGIFVLIIVGILLIAFFYNKWYYPPLPEN
jgi:hypothetical protein